MPKFKIGIATSGRREETEIVEADSLEEAEEFARDWAMEHISFWAEDIDEEEE